MLIKDAAILVVGILSPLIIIYIYNKTHWDNFVFTLQYIMGGIILISSGYLIWFNIKNFSKNKPAALVFLLLSVVSFLYISYALVIQLALRRGFSI